MRQEIVLTDAQSGPCRGNRGFPSHGGRIVCTSPGTVRCKPLISVSLFRKF